MQNYWNGEFLWHLRWKPPSTLGRIRMSTRTQNSRILIVCSTLLNNLWKNTLKKIVNVRCLEYSSPTWVRSVLPNDQAIKCAKAKVCVYADCVQCVGQMKDTPEAVERCKGQVEGLKLYSSYQDAMVIDEEAIEFEWKIFPGFSSLYVLEKIQQDLEKRKIEPEEFTDQIIFMSMFNEHCMEHQWWELCFECRKSEELRNEILKRTLDILGSRLGREVVWKF